MPELLTLTQEAPAAVPPEVVASAAGRVTVLEALATEASTVVSPDMSRISTQMGNGVDAEDD